MKLCILAVALIGSTLSANAGTFSEYFWIECDPTESRFEVRPVGALEEAEKLDVRLIEVNLQNADSGDRVEDPNSDRVSIAECTLPQPSGRLEFIVWQTSHAPTDDPSSGAEFAITANEVVLEEGQLGDTRVQPVDTVVFNGENISICPSSVPSYPQRTSNSPFGLVCRRIGNVGLTKLTANSE